MAAARARTGMQAIADEIAAERSERPSRITSILPTEYFADTIASPPPEHT